MVLIGVQNNLHALIQRIKTDEGDVSRGHDGAQPLHELHGLLGLHVPNAVPKENVKNLALEFQLFVEELVVGAYERLHAHVADVLVARL